MVQVTSKTGVYIFVNIGPNSGSKNYKQKTLRFPVS
jgi:hypothetical protein